MNDYAIQHGVAAQLEAPSSCGCCEGTAIRTPKSVFNRPGLSQLSYRIGTHATFLESLLARIASYGVNERAKQQLLASTILASPAATALRSTTTAGFAERSGELAPGSRLLNELLTTREKPDFTIALFDAWASLADVLTFYQERLANEGFIRTAQEQRSLYELSRLVGYRPRPGVSASVYLAFEVEDTANQNIPSVGGFGAASPADITRAINTTAQTIGSPAEIVIPIGTNAKSTPTPGSIEQPQTFETLQELIAKTDCNAIRLRTQEPQRITAETVFDLEYLYFNKTGLRLQPNDYLAVQFDPIQPYKVHRIQQVIENNETQVTTAVLFLDDLSPKRLIHELTQIVEDLSTLVVDESLERGESDTPTDEFEVTRNLIREVLYGNSHTLDRTIRLLEIDSSFQELLCTRLTNEIAQADIASNSGKFGIAVRKTQAALYELLDLKKVSGRYKEVTLPLLSELNKKVEVKQLDVLIKNLSPTANLRAQTLAIISNFLRNECVPNLATLESLFLSGDPTVVNGTTPFAVLRSALEVNGKDDSANWSANITLLSGSAPTLKCSASFPSSSFDLLVADSTHWAVSPITLSTCKVEELLAALSLVESTDESRRDYQIGIKSDKGHSLVIQRTNKTGDPDPEPHINPVARIEVASDTKVTFPDILELGSAAPTADRYAARLTTFGHSDSDLKDVFLPPPAKFDLKRPDPLNRNVWHLLSTNASSALLTDLKESLKSITYARPSLNASPNIQEDVVSVVVEVFRKDKSVDFTPDNCVACGIVHFIQGPAIASKSDLAQPLAKSLAAHFNAIANTAKNFNDEAKSLKDDLWPPSDPPSTTLDTAAAKLTNATTISESLTAINTLPELNGDIASRLKLKPLIDSVKTRKDNYSSQIREDMNKADPAATESIFAPYGKKSSMQPFIARVQDDVAHLIAKSSEIRLSDLNEEVTKLRLEFEKQLGARVKWVKNTLTGVRDQIAGALLKRRKVFATDVRDRIDHYKPFLKRIISEANNSPEFADERLVLNKLKEDLELLTEDFRLRVGAFYDKTKEQADDNKNAFETIKKGGDKCNALLCLIDRLGQVLGDGPVSNAPGTTVPRDDVLKKLTGKRRATAESIVQSLQNVRRRINPGLDRFAVGESAPNEVADAVRQLSNLQLASDTTRGQLLTDFFTLVSSRSDLVAKLSSVLGDNQRRFLFAILRNSRVLAPTIEPKVFAFRGRAKLFGWNVPDTLTSILTFLNKHGLLKDIEAAKTDLKERHGIPISSLQKDDSDSVQSLYLDGPFERTTTGSIIGIDRGEFDGPSVLQILDVTTVPLTKYGLSNTSSHLKLHDSWWSVPDSFPDEKEFAKFIRNTSILCDAEQLELHDGPIDFQLDEADRVECDQVIEGLSVGRQVIFEGEPIVVGTQSDAVHRELMTVTDVNHVIDHDLWNDTFHTTIRFDRSTSLPYKRESVRIYANVVPATHGETHKEVLGSGNAAQAFQAFGLQRSGVTQLPAPSPRGTDDQLTVYVNDATWHEEESFIELKPDDRKYVALVGSEQHAEVVFGDGEKGARLPTGVENIAATYRTGVGHDGNVAARQIDQVVGAPLGVKKVINPLPAQGGADPDSEDLIRTRAALEVSAMDRLVSVKDYADFARNYAGIGKASAVRLQGLVHVTVAGLTSEPFDMDGPLIRNLQHAMEIFGDPSQHFRLVDREAKLLIIVANIGIERDRQWEKIEPNIRRALRARFRYEDADLGQDVLLSDAIATIHSVDGVSYVDIDKFDAVDQRNITDLVARLSNLRRLPRIHVPVERLEDSRPDANGSNQVPRKDANLANPVANGDDVSTNRQANNRAVSNFRPAQVCYLSPDIPGTLILEQAR